MVAQVVQVVQAMVAPAGVLHVVKYAVAAIAGVLLVDSDSCIRKLLLALLIR